jgi:membrane associated rhomboid family serine protease
MHYAGNMLFLLVFGLRVNELIGDLKFAIVYPILAMLSGWGYLISASGEHLHPMLGASGAIMGLAGMYFVFFPVQHVHVGIWFRFVSLIRISRLFLKIFRMRGFWLLVLWIGFNDVLPVYFPTRGDHVAHWGHLSGFMAGATIAIAMLITRTATARGADLVSFALGKYAWPLLGKPNTNIEAPIEGPPKQKVRWRPF